MTLNYKRTSIALALMSGISAYAANVDTAHAITLMDLLRGGPGPGAGNGRAVAEPRPVSANRSPLAGERNLADPEPAPKITGPRYHTYKADAERAIKTSGFAVSSLGDGAALLSQSKVTAPAEIAGVLEAFYAKNSELLWVADSDVSQKAKDVLALFERAGEYGLEPADYLLQVPDLMTASVTPPADPAAPAEVSAQPAQQGDAHQQALMQFELALSKKVLVFAQDMVRGRIDPNRISGYHDFKLKDVKLPLVLPFVKSTPDAAAYLEGLAPKSVHFQQLKAELAKLRAEAASEGEGIELPDNLLLKPGASNPALSGVIGAIRKRGSDALKTKHSSAFAAYQDSPEYTPDLVELVKSFQAEVGLKPDGVVGLATVRKIVGHSVEDKIAKLVVAMEQARWLPDDLGSRHVFINQPAYQAYYHDHGREQFSMRVVVGSKSNQTYFFQDEIETVEFNPYWGVPQSIIVNEMLPKLRQDPSYLDRMGYEVAVNGKAVPSSAVNWYASTQNVSVRQPPSSDNALGDLKILFPNSHAIYMHDTPSKSFFQKDMRALSHGCVRLAEPRKMAAAVLGTTIEDVNARIAGGQNVAAKVTAKIPVYIAYFTAWPNKDGKVEYFDDVYDRDEAVSKAFKATTAARSS